MPMTSYEVEFLEHAPAKPGEKPTRVVVSFHTNMGIHKAKKIAWDELEKKVGGRAHSVYYTMMYCKEQAVQTGTTMYPTREPETEEPLRAEVRQPDLSKFIKPDAVQSVTKQLRFESAHQLKGWEWSKCHRLHGHSYVLEVTVTGPLDIYNAIIDFERLGDILKNEVHSKLDHQNLNEVLNLHNATAEAICIWIWGQIAQPIELLVENAKLQHIRLYETQTSWVDMERT